MKHLLILLCIAFTTTATAQFNSKVGYSAMLLNMDQVSSIFDAYSSENADILVSDLSSISVSHGLELGARYGISNLTFEIGIISGQGESIAIKNTGEEVKWKASMFDYHFNIVQHFNNLGFGVGVANQQVRLREFNPITSQFVDTTHEKQWSGRVFLQIEVPSRLVSFAIRPYYQFSFDSYETAPIAEALSVEPVADQSLKVFGLSIIFFNGPQSGW